jgi:hypothetical protein
MSFRFLLHSLAVAAIAGAASMAVPAGRAEAAALPVAGPVSLTRDAGAVIAVRYHHPYGYHGHYRYHGRYGYHARYGYHGHGHYGPYPYRRHHAYGHYGYHHMRHGY